VQTAKFIFQIENTVQFLMDGLV